MNDFDQLQSIIKDIKGMINVSVKDEGVDRRKLIKLLKFINKMVQVVDQSFENILTVLIDIKYLNEKDLNTERLVELQKEVDLLLDKDYFRETELICSRLHALSDQFQSEIQPIISQLKQEASWSYIYSIINEHEGAIIMMTRELISDFQAELSKVTPANLPTLNKLAADRARELKTHLTELRRLRDQLVGYSDVGVLELLEQPESDSPRNEIILHVDGRIMGDNFSNISGSTIITRSTVNTDNINKLANEQSDGNDNFQEELKELVVKGNLTDCFEKLIAYLKSKKRPKEINNILTIASNVNMIEMAKDIGTKSPAEFEAEITKIKHSLLKLIDAYTTG